MKQSWSFQQGASPSWRWKVWTLVVNLRRKKSRHSAAGWTKEQTSVEMGQGKKILLHKWSVFLLSYFVSKKQRRNYKIQNNSFQNMIKNAGHKSITSLKHFCSASRAYSKVTRHTDPAGDRATCTQFCLLAWTKFWTSAEMCDSHWPEQCRGREFHLGHSLIGSHTVSWLKAKLSASEQWRIDMLELCKLGITQTPPLTSRLWK